MARGERSNKPIFQNPGPEAYCPNVTGQARSSPLNSKSKRGELPLTLKIRMDIMVEDHIFPVRALVDTGAEVNIIRRGVIPDNFLQKDSHPLTLRGANETKLKGGNLCIRGVCTMEGKAVVGQQPVKIQCALHMYEADISVQAILSYKWLADQNFIVHPRRHGLYFQDENLEVFVSGLQGEDKRPSARLDKVVAIRLQEVPIGLIPSDPLAPASAPPASSKGKERVPYPNSPSGSDRPESRSSRRGSPRGGTVDPATSSSSLPSARNSPKPPSPQISRPGTPYHVSGQKEEDFGEPTRVSCYNSEGKPRMLDLFSGTGSTAAAFRKRGYEVVTLDYDQKFSPDILTDVLAWDFQSTFPPDSLRPLQHHPRVLSTVLP